MAHLHDILTFVDYIGTVRRNVRTNCFDDFDDMKFRERFGLSKNTVMKLTGASKTIKSHRRSFRGKYLGQSSPGAVLDSEFLGGGWL